MDCRFDCCGSRFGFYGADCSYFCEAQGSSVTNVLFGFFVDGDSRAATLCCSS